MWGGYDDTDNNDNNKNKIAEITNVQIYNGTYHNQERTFLRTSNRPCRPPSLLISVYQGSFLNIQRLQPEADHLPPSSPNVTNEWSYTSTLPIRRHGKDRYFIFSLKIH
jgi:hypothetical protein